MLKKIAALGLCAVVALSFTSCKGGGASVTSNAKPNLYTANEEFADSAFEQLKPPQSGEEIVVISTNKGDIKVRLFPEIAPQAVENFKGHANNKYYDGTIFHRVIEGFVIQGGDPLGNGMGGESIWGGKFGLEIHPELHHIRGALAMARASEPRDSQGSQFYIVQNDDLDKTDSSGSLRKELERLLETQDEIYFEEGDEILRVGDIMPAEFLQSYLKNGGTYKLDFDYTVFGQVFSGMDVVDAIAAVKTTSDRPNEDVVIESVRVEKYE